MLSQDTKNIMANLFVTNVELSDQIKEKDAQIAALKKEIDELKHPKPTLEVVKDSA